MDTKPKYNFRRSCLLKSGRFEGFNSWRSVTGHLIAGIGLVIMAKSFWVAVIHPAIKGAAPKWERLKECMFFFHSQLDTKRDLLGNENNEVFGKAK